MRRASSFAIFALFLLLAAQPVSALWSQALNITVVDMNGMPVKYASVTILYQKALPDSTADGREQGQTNEEGSFSVLLSNSVPQSQEKKSYSVSISTYYWAGSNSQFEVDNAGQKNLRLTIPFKLENVTVKAVPPENLPPGSQVSIYGSPVIEPFLNGVAILRVPTGLRFSGYVISGENRKLFYSDSASADKDGRRSINVIISDSWSPENNQGPQQATRIISPLTFFSPDGEPFANQPITYYYRGRQQTATTDGNGAASFDAFVGISINMTMVVDEHQLNIAYVPEGSMPDTIKLPHLLTIEPLAPVREGENCYRVTAKISDPRKQLPLQVVFTSSDGKTTTNMTASTDEQGMLFVRPCIQSNTIISVKASNKYDVAEASVGLEYAVPVPSGQTSTTLPPDTKKQTEDFFLWALVAIGIAILAGVVFFAKNNLGGSFSFILNYLRMLYRSTQQTRRPAPVLPGSENQPQQDQQAIDISLQEPKKSLISRILPARREKPGDDQPSFQPQQKESSSQPLWQPKQSQPAKQPDFRSPSQMQQPPVQEKPVALQQSQQQTQAQPPAQEKPVQPAQPPMQQAPAQPQTPPKAAPKPIVPPKLPPKQ
ncbi:MAG: hypothetical protein WCT52_01990 [Candidatus Micrarchaeia archaeon]